MQVMPRKGREMTWNRVLLEPKAPCPVWEVRVALWSQGTHLKLSLLNAKKRQGFFLEVWNRLLNAFVWSNNDIQWLVSSVLKGNGA